MKNQHRNLEFLFVPICILVLVVMAVTLLVMQFRSFEHAYIKEARETLAQQAHFVSRTLRPALLKGDLEAVDHYINVYSGKPMRITVISEDGTVVADSDVPATQLGNHADRIELADPNLREQYVERYSSTMESRLFYYVVQLEEGWFIRLSMPLAVQAGAITSVWRTAAFAILLGAVLAIAAAAYLFFRVAPHFNSLQASAVAIAKGHLDTTIHIPRNGLLRELAKALSVMARQLKSRIYELERERSDFDALFNALREPLLLISDSGALLSFNRAAEKLFGADIRTPSFRLAHTHCPELSEYVRDAFEQTSPHGREIAFNDHGFTRSLLARAVHIQRDDTPCVLLLLTDLTDLRRLEGFRSDFIANVSHEIKTPLTAILSTVETLLETPLDDAGRTKCLDILARQSRRLNALVMDILSLAAIERRQSTRKQDFTPLRLDAIVRETLSLCQDETERAGIALRTKAPLPEITLQGDAHLLEQALINLITNATRYSGSKDILVDLKRSATEAILTVEDHGCGIDAEHLPRLFERFYRVHKERSRERGGTGLGLAIVKHILILHHGTVSVHSIPGQGTTFTLTLPCA